MTVLRAYSEKCSARILIAVFMVASGCHCGTCKTAAPRSPAATVVVPGEYLMRLEAGSDPLELRRVLSRVEVLHRFRIPPDLYAVRIPDAGQEAQIVSELKRDKIVRYVEPNRVNYADGDYGPFSGQWALKKINAAPAWTAPHGSETVCVATLDSGIDFGQYPELAGLIWTNTAEDGKDKDSNGYINDVHGFMAIGAGNASPGSPVPAGDPKDDNGHGTWVAGVIAGVVGEINAVETHTPLPKIQIIPCKFLNAAAKGTTADAVKCLEYVATVKDHKQCNVVATNNSWGEDAKDISQALNDAIAAQQERGILFVASAGNSGANMDPENNHHYPANCPLANVLAVAATDQNDAIGSNWGRHAVHVAAPGFEIQKMDPTGKPKKSSWSTSLATPHVTGVIALLDSQPSPLAWTAVRNLVIAGGESSLSHPRKIASSRRVAVWAVAALATGAGSLTCKDQVVQARLLPTVESMQIAKGGTVDLAALHINCAMPNGAPVVEIKNGSAADTITLHDDGLEPDQIKDDGIYAARWQPANTGSYELPFPTTEVELKKDAR